MIKDRVAVVIDVVESSGGAERVLDKVLEIYPNCDLFSLYYTTEARKRIEEKFPKIKIFNSVFQLLVKGDRGGKYISLIKLISWLYWELLDLKKYDLIISLSHSFSSKNVKRESQAKHLSYLFTPPRYLYKEFNEIGWIKKIPLNWILWFPMKILRFIDRIGAGRPDMIVAISKEVGKRVEKYYRRQAEILFPPVEVLKIRRRVRKKDYYIFLSRLVKQKGAELVVRCCQRYQLPLVVVGEGGEMDRLKKLAGKTVKFTGRISDEKRNELLAGAKALLYASVEEDFGIVPLEALAVGTPVVAFKSGGVKETIKERISGVFFERYDEKSLKKAIDKLDKIKFDSEMLKNEARSYRPEVFKGKFKKMVEKLRKKNQVRLWGLAISCLSLSETVNKILSWSSEKKARVVHCVGLNDIRMAEETGEIKSMLHLADLLTADGMPLVWLGRRRGIRGMERVYGPDLMEAIFNRRDGRELGHFFLGSRPEVVKDLISNLKNNGNFYYQSWSPDFKKSFSGGDYQKMAKKIRDKKIKIVWVGLGESKQIVSTHELKKLLPDKVFITVGAAFDFISGHKRQAPRWIRQSGGEWLFRLINEPGRLIPRYWQVFKFVIKESLRS